MTVYCYDTEFLEDGRTIELISIGIVCEDGREYYAVNSEMPYERIKQQEWLCQNVVPHLPLRGKVEQHTSGSGHYWSLDTFSPLVKPKWVIANEVREFLVGGIKPVGERDGGPVYDAMDLPELWAYFGAYDHVALAQLWGRMIDMPDLIPMFTHDLMQLISPMRGYSLPKRGGDDLHDALADARWNMRVLMDVRHAALMERGPR